jgi:hypothetical protein
MTTPLDIVSARTFSRNDFRSKTSTILHDGDVVILEGCGIFRIKVVSKDTWTWCSGCDLSVDGLCRNTYYRCILSPENPDSMVAMAKKINHD